MLSIVLHARNNSKLPKKNCKMNQTKSFHFSEAKNGKLKRLGFSTSRLIYIATLNIEKVIRVITVEVDKWYCRHSTFLDCDNSALRVRKKRVIALLISF
jgi:hypothetical protein